MGRSRPQLRYDATTLRPADPVAAALTTSAMASSFSNGVFHTVSTLFFTRSRPGRQPGRPRADHCWRGRDRRLVRRRPHGRSNRRTGRLVTTTVSQGLALLAYPATATLTAFTLVACLAVASKAAQGTSRATVLAHAFTGADRVLTRARLGVVITVVTGEARSWHSPWRPSRPHGWTRSRAGLPRLLGVRRHIECHRRCPAAQRRRTAHHRRGRRRDRQLGLGLRLRTNQLRRRVSRSQPRQRRRRRHARSPGSLPVIRTCSGVTYSRRRQTWLILRSCLARQQPARRSPVLRRTSSPGCHGGDTRDRGPRSPCGRTSHRPAQSTGDSSAGRSAAGQSYRQACQGRNVTVPPAT